MSKLDELQCKLKEVGAKIVSVNTVITQHGGQAEQTFYEIAGHPLILVEYGNSGWDVFRPVTVEPSYNATIDAVMDFCVEAKREPKW